MTDEEKIRQVLTRLDGVECTCGKLSSSQSHWFWQNNRTRMATLCRICDADLIEKYGDEESVEGYIDLNKWPLKGLTTLYQRIYENR